MSYQEIKADAQLEPFCRELAGAKVIGMDTEFVAEHTYRPQLCLVQVAWDGGRLALIDAMALSDMRPFWEVLAQPGHATVVHAGRGDIEFSLHAVGRPPAGLIDVQLAAGLAGFEYPAGYGSLLSRLLGVKSSKHETRTDWRHRPLTSRQIEYALDDVRHLDALRNVLIDKLISLGRLDWLTEEMATFQRQIER
ncbi:MAG: ribonuclease D, partial [Pirellulales bacterium]|nr:ribonuclease D [Pirellulales bacterium]